MKKPLNLVSFMEKYRSQEQCLKHLIEIKWGAGYRCRKCDSGNWGKGKTWYYRRCKACGYDESATANTLFHKLKFPLPTAFLIIHQLTTMKKGMSTMEIGRQHGIHQESAWFFKRKVQQAMSEVDNLKLSRLVEVDEAVIGGFESGAIGRTHGKKKPIQIAVELGSEHRNGQRVQMKRAKAVRIDNYSSLSLSMALESMISKETVVITDKWKSYIKAVGNRTHLPLPSAKGEEMPEIHRLIFNLKNWLRGIHHKVSTFHLQSYLNEFFFRFNFRNVIHSLPNMILEKMINHSWIPYKSIIAS